MNDFSRSLLINERKNMTEIRCYGCGAILQSDDEKKVGYITKENLKKEHPLCLRCFKLQHYHQLGDTDLTKDDYLEVLQTISDKDCLIVYMIDLFDFNGSIIDGLNRHLNSDNILVVANKRDVFPKEVNNNKILSWLQKQLKEQGLQYQDIEIISTLKKYNIGLLLKRINQLRNNKDVYVVGVTNVGKSTLINSLLEKYAVDNKLVITTSEFPGTTLNLIEIPLDDKTSIYDTPGLVNDHQISHYIKNEALKAILPTKKIKPITYQLNDHQSLYFSGLARLDYVKGDKTSFTCNFSPYIKIERCKYENADKLFSNDNVLKIKPIGIESIKDFKKYNFSIPNYKVDVVISGLGYVSINSNKGNIDVLVPKNVGVFIRKALL